MDGIDKSVDEEETKIINPKKTDWETTAIKLCFLAGSILLIMALVTL